MRRHRARRNLLVASLVFLAALAGRAEPPIPLLVDGFECGSAIRWGDWVGGPEIATPAPGVFAPKVECEWNSVGVNDPYLDHLNVLATPLFADLPLGAPGSVEIVAVAYNAIDGGTASCQGTDPNSYGVLRILDGSTCALLTTVADPAHKLIAAAPPALGDLDGDGFVDIVALEAGSEVVAFRWNSIAGSYEHYWSSTETTLSARCRWDGVALHDLDDDGFPEVISGHEVYDGRTGARLDDGTVQPVNNLGVSTVAQVDDDADPDLVGENVWGWDSSTGVWVIEDLQSGSAGSTGLADFDADGIPEIARSAGSASLETFAGAGLYAVASIGSGPPAIADFDGDGVPEVAVGGNSTLSLMDLECEGTPEGCAAEFVRWSRPVQDLSSGRSASAAFDFDLDGRAEVIFADECYVRVFDGIDGEVLASVARRSCTWNEGPTIGDLDGDGSAEIVIGSNANCAVACPAVDPIDRGLRCETGTDCLSGTCDAGYCRCGDGGDCPGEQTCAAPPAGTPGSGDTCRAAHPGALVGVRVIGDALDRWGPARAIWNQVAYTVTNVEDDGGIPKSADWVPNFLVPNRNDFNAQDSLCAPKH